MEGVWMLQQASNKDLCEMSEQSSGWKNKRLLLPMFTRQQRTACLLSVMMKTRMRFFWQAGSAQDATHTETCCPWLQLKAAYLEDWLAKHIPTERTFSLAGLRNPETCLPAIGFIATCSPAANPLIFTKVKQDVQEDDGGGGETVNKAFPLPV